MKTYHNATATKRIWWNRWKKVWTLQNIDADGNQIGNADYCFSRCVAFAWLEI